MLSPNPGVSTMVNEILSKEKEMMSVRIGSKNAIALVDETGSKCCT
jgi:hypothetical protein